MSDQSCICGWADDTKRDASGWRGITGTGTQKKMVNRIGSVVCSGNQKNYFQDQFSNREIVIQREPRTIYIGLLNSNEHLFKIKFICSKMNDERV